MDFGAPTRPRAGRETIVPMINVVFLLLIFFLMSAQIAPPDPLTVRPPEGQGQGPAEVDEILYISAEGTLALGPLRDEAVFAGLAAAPATAPLAIRADADLPAATFAEVLSQLAAVGRSDVALLMVPAP